MSSTQTPNAILQSSSFYIQLARNAKINMILDWEDVIMRTKGSCSVLRPLWKKKKASIHWAVAPEFESSEHKGTSVGDYSGEFSTKFPKCFLSNILWFGWKSVHLPLSWYQRSHSYLLSLFLAWRILIFSYT
jgi:hypothetical protein